MAVIEKEPSEIRKGSLEVKNTTTDIKTQRMQRAVNLDPAKCQVSELKDKFELFQISEKMIKRL